MPADTTRARSFSQNYSGPWPISQYKIAKAIDVPARRINEIVHGKRAISADIALRLSRALGLSDVFFTNMQAHYDAEVARQQLAGQLARIDRIARPPLHLPRGVSGAE